MDAPQTIEVRFFPQSDQNAEKVLGRFPPSQINALLGILRNSHGYFHVPGDELYFRSWQWMMPESDTEDPYIEVFFGSK